MWPIRHREAILHFSQNAVNPTRDTLRTAATASATFTVGIRGGLDLSREESQALHFVFSKGNAAMATNVGLCGAERGQDPARPRRSPYTAPRVVFEFVKAAVRGYHLASIGTGALSFLCEASTPSCNCTDYVAPRVAQVLPVPAGLPGSALPELQNRPGRKAGALAAAVRVGVRVLVRKAFGFLGKWLGTVVGALFSPAGAIVGAAIGIAVGGLVASVVCAPL
jgi:hypothetical protein